MTKKCNKLSLTRAVSERLGITTRESSKVVDAVLNELIDAIGRGESVTLAGLGSIIVEERGEKFKKVVGKKVFVEAKKVLRFVTSAKMDATLNPSERIIIEKYLESTKLKAREL